MGKDFVRQSIIANVGAFVKKLSNVELHDLTMFVCYTPNVAPTHNIENETQRRFVDEILGSHDWEMYINDLIKPKQYFLSSSGSFRSNLDLIEKILHSEIFFRFQVNMTPKIVIEPLYTKQEKKTLTDILGEHKAMLEYQLEDEKAIIDSCGDDGEELIALKKKHLIFLEKFAH
jgi:hypothetical protein